MDGESTPCGQADPALKVALVTETYPPEVNGVALTLARLVEGLCRRGHRVQLVRPRQYRREKPSNAPALDEILTPGLPIPGYPGLRFGLPQRRELVHLWSRHRPHVVHVATEGPLGMAAVAAARQLHIPVSSGYHTNFQAYSRHYRIGWLNGLVSAHLRRFHNRTSLTLVPTRELACRLADDGYRDVEVLARGVDTHLFNPGRRSIALRRAWAADDDTLVVAYVGRIAPEKNLPLVTRAFEAIRAGAPAVRMLFVGEGPALASLKRRHPEYIFAGLRRGSDLAAHYASADLFLFPSLTETYGNVVPEAMASGLGVVAFRCAAAADLIEDGVNGRTVTAGDENGFVDAAVALAGNRRLLADVRRSAHGSIGHLDWNVIQDAFARKLASLHLAHEAGHDNENRLLQASN